MTQKHDGEEGVKSPEEQTQDASGKSRRGFLKAAGTAAAGVLAGGITAAASEAAPQQRTAAAAPKKAAATRTAAAATKLAGGIPVPVANAEKMVSGTYPKGPVMATGRAIGANDRINVAFVGVGGMGGAHVGHFAAEAADRNIVIGGICDVFQPRIDQRVAFVKEKNAAAPTLVADTDYRRLIENKDIDAIVIATPEHWHGQVAVQAMEAGKHVYIQKPMTRYLDEAFQVHDAALRYKRVVQVGSQGCSDGRWHAAGKAIRDGKIGAMVMGQGSYTRNSSDGEWNYGIDGRLSKETLDWEKWLGSAPKRGFDDSKGGARHGEDPKRDDAKARFARYRKYWDYSGGILGDLMPHKLHPFLIASGKPEYPVSVTSIGTRLGDDREVDDTVQVLAVFPSNWSMLFVGSTVNEQGIQDMFRGQKATIYFGQNVELRPERPFSEEIEGGPIPLEGPGGESHQRHEKNWLAAIRGAEKPNCDIDLATKVQVIVSLGEMSARLNKTILFDEKTRKITMG